MRVCVITMGLYQNILHFSFCSRARLFFSLFCNVFGDLIACIQSCTKVSHSVCKFFIICAIVVNNVYKTYATMILKSDLLVTYCYFFITRLW